MHHGTVSSADRLSQGVIAWPQVRRIPMKTSKKWPKKKNIPKKSAPAAGHGTPSPPRMDTLWGPRAGPEPQKSSMNITSHINQISIKIMSILLGKSKNKRANGETDLGSGPRDQTQTQKSHTQSKYTKTERASPPTPAELDSRRKVRVS